MATQVIEFAAASGVSVTAKLFSLGSDTQVASQSATEQTNRKGIYTASFTDVPAGCYRVVALSGTTPVASWWVDLLLQSGTFAAYEIPISVMPGGGSQNINVYPVTSSTAERVNGTTITLFHNEDRSVSIGTDTSLSGLSLRFVVEDYKREDVAVITSISVSGTTATVAIPSTVTANVGQYYWALRDITSGNSVLARGVLAVQYAAEETVLLP